MRSRLTWAGAIGLVFAGHAMAGDAVVWSFEVSSSGEDASWMSPTESSCPVS